MPTSCGYGAKGTRGVRKGAMAAGHPWAWPAALGQCCRPVGTRTFHWTELAGVSSLILESRCRLDPRRAQGPWLGLPCCGQRPLGWQLRWHCFLPWGCAPWAGGVPVCPPLGPLAGPSWGPLSWPHRTRQLAPSVTEAAGPYGSYFPRPRDGCWSAGLWRLAWPLESRSWAATSDFLRPSAPSAGSSGGSERRWWECGVG